jgi:hypothetical protein
MQDDHASSEQASVRSDEQNSQDPFDDPGDAVWDDVSLDYGKAYDDDSSEY